MHARPAASLDPVWRQPDFRQGARDMVDIALGLGAWGLVAGVAMVKSGLGVPLSVLMTLVVFAGSAQLAALPLIASGAPIWLVWATAFCVNLRFVIFSAQWRPYFAHLPVWRRVLLGYFSTDTTYAIFMRRYREPQPAPEQLAYFWGGAAMNWAAWQMASLAGILLADRVPTAWGLGFAGTLALLGLAGSLLSDRATWVSAVVAGCAAVAAYALPLRLNIVVAIACAVAVGVLLDDAKPRQTGAGA